MRRLALVVLLSLLVAPSAGAWTWPVRGPVLETFSFDPAQPYAAGQRRGIAIGAEAGAPVRAPAAGVVTFAGTVPTSGKTLTIQTDGGLAVTLTHLGSVAIARGATVEEGAVVGAVGPSGTAEFDVPYVHLGIRRADDDQGYLDPLRFLPVLAPPPPASVPTSAPAPVASPAPPTPAPAPSRPPAPSPAPSPAPAPAAPPAPATPAPVTGPAAAPTPVVTVAPTTEAPAAQTQAPQTQAPSAAPPTVVAPSGIEVRAGARGPVHAHAVSRTPSRPVVTPRPSLAPTPRAATLASAPPVLARSASAAAVPVDVVRATVDRSPPSVRSAGAAPPRLAATGGGLSAPRRLVLAAALAGLAGALAAALLLRELRRRRPLVHARSLAVVSRRYLDRGSLSR